MECSRNKRYWTFFLSGFNCFDDFTNTSGSRHSHIKISIFELTALHAAWSWWLVVLSYARNPARFMCPVRSAMIFSGTFFSNKRLAAVARREWFVYLGIPSTFSHILAMIVFKVLTPTGTFTNQGLSGSEGTFSTGRR